MHQEKDSKSGTKSKTARQKAGGIIRNAFCETFCSDVTPHIEQINFALSTEASLPRLPDPAGSLLMPESI
jgi:hypothetical protein